MNAAPYDILKKDALGNPIWVEAVEDLPKATVRIEELALRSPGEYRIYCVQPANETNCYCAGRLTAVTVEEHG